MLIGLVAIVHFVDDLIQRVNHFDDDGVVTNDAVADDDVMNALNDVVTMMMMMLMMQMMDVDYGNQFHVVFHALYSFE